MGRGRGGTEREEEGGREGETEREGGKGERRETERGRE